MEMASEVRAFDVRNEIVRHGFVIELPDQATRRDAWAAFSLSPREQSDEMFILLGFYRTPREAYQAVLAAEDERLVQR